MELPVLCRYAPPGEYMKDHSLVHYDGWWHLFSISGTAGYCHAYTGNEETISWSISKDLVNWEFRGHVLHASQRKGHFDQHEIWAPYVIQEQGKFYMFYTGIIHPRRFMSYQKIGHQHKFDFTGHKETQGLAISEDLTSWEKVSPIDTGLGVPGRDAHVVYDEEQKRWLLYSTGQKVHDFGEAYVSQSKNLVDWEFIGVCARFPMMENIPYTPTESLTVMRHPINGKWIMLGNWHYAVSDNPEDFSVHEVRKYDFTFNDSKPDIGFAGEIVQHEGRWYRSGVIGMNDHWLLGFTEIEWDNQGAFHISVPSIYQKAHY